MSYYYDSAEGMTISKDRAEAEVMAHGIARYALVLEFGVKSEYDAQALLRWLGY